MADTMGAGRARDGGALLVEGGEVMAGTVGGRRDKDAGTVGTGRARDGRHCGWKEGK